MTNIDELIETAQRLCDRLTKAAEDEKKFSYQICNELERLSWETHKMANDLKNLR